MKIFLITFVFIVFSAPSALAQTDYLIQVGDTAYVVNETDRITYRFNSAVITSTPWWGSEALARSAYRSWVENGGASSRVFAYAFSGGYVYVIGYGYNQPLLRGERQAEYYIVMSSNSAPTANAGPDQTVAAATVVTLDGRASSDGDGDALTYTWTQTSGTTVTLSGSTTSQPTFTAPALAVGDPNTTLVFTLTVNDGAVSSFTDTVSITIEAPTNSAPTANAGPDQTVAAATVVTLDGRASSDGDGDALTYTWTQTSGTTVTLSGSTTSQPTFTAPALAVGDPNTTLVFTLTVNDGTANSLSDSVTITVQAQSPTPATAFLQYEDEIRTTFVDNIRRNLTSSIAVEQRFMQGVRSRVVYLQKLNYSEANQASRSNVASDLTGMFDFQNSTLSTRGNFSKRVGNIEGSYNRLLFTDFDVQHDTDTTSATLSARMSWERLTNQQNIIGYFLGVELGTSNISGPFRGDQDRVTVSVGSYLVHDLAGELFVDGFLRYGIGRNRLDMANDVLSLTSDYTTRTATAGAALSGVYQYERYELRPELALSYGKTWIGSVGFTGRAYGLVDDTVSMDAGTVSIANLTLRPEVIWALDGDTVATSNSQLSLAPRAICERTLSISRVEDCGGGFELGFSRSSDDDLSSIKFRTMRDRIGNSYRSSLALHFEYNF